MKRLLTLLLALAALPLFGNSMPDAEAKKLLAELAKASEKYQPRSGKTVFFSRAQLKYGLERNDYLRRWCDRPLMQDSSFARSGTLTVDNSGNYSTKGFINRQAYTVEAELLKKFHLAGFAFFPELTGRRDIYNHVGAPGTADIVLLPEYFFQFTKLTPDQVEKRMEIAEQALKCPNVYRLNGKIVITSYPISMDTEFWSVLKAELNKRFGDKFLLMPWMPLDYGLRPSGKNKTYTVADINKMRERLRSYLRVVDGFYYNTPPFNNRRYHWEFDREVAIPIIHSVLMEEEFKDKYLGWGVKVGHMNCHLQPFAVDAYGTNTLRGTIEAAVLAKADFVNCVEWDEENENTCFRPLTTTGFSTLRLIRAFEQQANGKPFTPLAGDDVTIPNLILSYSRVLAAGQPLEFELTNIPDGNEKSAFTATLELYNNDGKLLHRFAPVKIKSGTINAEVLKIPSEKLLRHRFINPVLTVDGKRFDAGFYPIEIRSWWHWDYLWAKHVLRDMPPAETSAGITLGEADANGMIPATVKVSSPRPLRSVEIITADNLVTYSYSKTTPDFRENKEQVGFRISLQAHSKNDQALSGTLKFVNSPNIKIDSTRNAFRGTGTTWTLNNFLLNVRPQHRFVAIPRSELADAELHIDIPGLAENKRIKLADVAAAGSIGLGGKHCANLVIVRNNLQTVMPEPVNEKELEFTVMLRPDSADAGFFVQIVNDKFQIFRSKKVSALKTSGKTRSLNVFSMSTNSRTTIKVAEELVKKVSWDFSGKRGSIVPCSLGQHFDGICGGFTPLATGYGQSESLAGNAVNRVLKNTKADQHAPAVVTANGIPALKFSGAQYVTLPLGMIPPYAGYRIDMEVYVEKKGGKIQTLLTDTRDAFTLQLNNLTPVAMNYLNQLTEIPGARPMVLAHGPRLNPWQWNKISVIYDQDTCQVIVNGTPGKKVKCSGYHRYPRATTLGASERGEFFHGMIRNFTITPQ